MHFKQVEDQIRDHTKYAFEEIADREFMNDTNNLNEFKKKIKTLKIKKEINLNNFH